MTTKQIIATAKQFDKVLKNIKCDKRELYPHIYDDGNCKWLQLMSSFHLVNVKCNDELDLPEYKEDVLGKYTWQKNSYDTEIEIPTLKELRKYMKDNAIKCNFSNRLSWRATYQLSWKTAYQSGEIMVNVKFLYSILQLLGNPKAKIISRSGALSSIYFENDNGEYALLLPIRRPKEGGKIPYNVMVQMYKRVELRDVPDGAMCLTDECGRIRVESNNGLIRCLVDNWSYHNVWHEDEGRYISEYLNCPVEQICNPEMKVFLVWTKEDLV